MRVLILGGTGAMGIHLTKLLSDRGFETVVTSRKKKPSKGNIRYVKGNARDPEFLYPLLAEKWDAVIDFMAYRTAEFKERAQMMLESTEQYLFLSSARVYADSATPLTESSPRLLDTSEDEAYLATDEYALAKAMQENILQESGHTNWTIIRPYITYSENRLQLGVLEKESWLYRALHGRTIVFSSDIASKITTLTYGLDVSEGISALIGAPEAFGQTFHITIEEPIRWDRALEIYQEEIEHHSGHKPKILLTDLDHFYRFHPGTGQVKYDRLFNRRFDNSAIARFLNVESFVKPEDGLRHCIREFLKNPQFNHIDWKAEAIKDRQSGERTALSEIPGAKQKTRYLLHRYAPAIAPYILK